MPTRSIPNLPQPSLFTLSPIHLAGRRALKGFEFQTAYIAYVLSGFAAGHEDFVSCRIEAVQDLDAIVRAQDTWIERYYQIKSKQEGAGNWTLNLLDREGVLASLFTLFRNFRLLSSHPDRRIELAIAVDGELDSDLVRLRDEGVRATDSRTKLFAILCSKEVSSQDRSFEPFANAIREYCQDNASVLIGHGATVGSGLARIEAGFRDPIKRLGLPSGSFGQQLIAAAGEVASLLDEFIGTLRFDSRVGALLKDATFGRLVEAGDLSPDEGRTAADRLKRSIQEESALPTPTHVDHTVLRGWLGVTQRVRLQTKPKPDADAVPRSELLDEVSRTLQTECFVLLYGLSKIGKSQFASSLIDHDGHGENYFWYTFAGDADDLNRLTRQLAVWVGEKAGKWQILDDLERATIQPPQAFERLGRSAMSGSYLVLDDCHKATDNLAFDLLRGLTSKYWPDCHLILVSERKIPGAAALGAHEISLGGLTPRESLIFVTNLGVDMRDAVVQFAMLSVQVAGHPVMLRAAAKELPPKPSAAEVSALGQRIPSIDSAQAFLSDLSNRIFFELLKTQDQRTWLARMAAIAFPVTQELALALAQVKPRLQILAVDWNYLRSLLLDETRAGHYSVPALLQQVAAASSSLAERKTLQVTAARHVFRSAIASRNADFWDFQHALFALLGAERYDEAAMRFVLSFPSLIAMRSFQPLELLFLAMNSDLIHAKIADATARWFMLQFEVQLRVQDEVSPDEHRLRALIRRMRIHLTKFGGSVPPFGRTMLHVAIASLRIRANKDSQVFTRTGRHRMFAALNSAIRCAMVFGDVKLLADLVHFYDDLYPLVTRPNVELLKDALVQLPEGEPLPLSSHALIGVYTTYACDTHNTEVAMQLLDRHSELFRAANRIDAHCACELAAAIILHNSRASYREARQRLDALISHAADLQLSPQSLAHGYFSIADTYFAEGNYDKSTEYYQIVLHANFGLSGLHQITCERLCDSLIFLGKHQDAARIALADLRSHHAGQSSEQRARLYARLAYAYAEQGALRKAAISCLGLCRVATQSSSDVVDVLAGTLAGWVLAHFTYSDPAIPESTTKMIPDSKALSDEISPEELSKWRVADPFRSRRFVHNATLFELLKDWRRSEYLYQRALGIVLKSDHTADRFRETAFVYLTRLARVRVLGGKFEAATHEFRQAVELSVDSYRQTHGGTAIGGAAAYALLTASMDYPLRTCTDQDLARFFELLKEQFESASGFRAWVCYRESELLFERLAVQAAKRRLLEAMDLGLASSEYDLYWRAAQQRLLYRMHQNYARQDDWLRDALDVTLALAGDRNLKQYQRSFAELAVQAVGTATQGPFLLVASAVERLGGNWQEHAFLVIAYAIWRATTNARILSASRISLESILRSEAAFLSPSEFD